MCAPSPKEIPATCTPGRPARTVSAEPWNAILGLLLAVAFTLATQISLRRELSERTALQSQSVLQALMGDSQRLFANHFFNKADVYLHSGVYPSIFDQATSEKKLHLSQAADVTPAAHPPESHDHDEAEHEHHDGDHGDHGDHEDHDAVSGYLGPPRDWIDAFGRNFYPTRHTHLESRDEQREILPWLRLAAELNPNEVQTYTVAAYWLRQRMGKVKEAEQFLREGWRANPDSFEIIFELGRLHEENHSNPSRAHHLYELALRKWQQSETAKPDPDAFLFLQITSRLARLEEAEGHPTRAIQYLEMLRAFSPNPPKVDEQIANLKGKVKLAGLPEARH